MYDYSMVDLDLIPNPPIRMDFPEKSWSSARTPTPIEVWKDLSFQFDIHTHTYQNPEGGWQLAVVLGSLHILPTVYGSRDEVLKVIKNFRRYLEANLIAEADFESLV